MKIVVATEADFGAFGKSILKDERCGIADHRLTEVDTNITRAWSGRRLIEEHSIGGNAQRIVRIDRSSDPERCQTNAAARSSAAGFRQFRDGNTAGRRAVLKDEAIVGRIDDNFALRAGKGRDLGGGAAPKL